jgi:hypothetical protein
MEFAMIACVLVVPCALIYSPLRGIADFWRAIDRSFGVVGIVPLWLARRYTLQLEVTLRARRSSQRRRPRRPRHWTSR